MRKHDAQTKPCLGGCGNTVRETHGGDGTCKKCLRRQRAIGSDKARELLQYRASFGYNTGKQYQLA